MGAAALACEGISKRFGSAGPVLDGVEVRVTAGTTAAILGPSGGGKTTLLRIVAGLEVPDAGEVRLLGRRVTGEGVFLPAESRRVGLVFQDYALFPHLTVLENAAFGVPGPAGITRAYGALQLVGLSEAAHRRPHQLSGGEQQRVALARALAPEPRLLLLDEPFSNLDASLRAGIRDEVARLLERVGTTTVLVTHDRAEAFLLADRVFLLLAGRVVRSGPPEAIARDPGSREAARFLGETNLLPAVSDGEAADCEIGRVGLLTPESGAPPRGPVEVLLPRDGVFVKPARPEDEDPAAAVVLRAAFQGPFQLLEARLPSGLVVSVRCPARDTWRGLLRSGQRIRLRAAGPVPAFPRP